VLTIDLGQHHNGHNIVHDVLQKLHLEAGEEMHKVSSDPLMPSPLASQPRGELRDGHKTKWKLESPAKVMEAISSALQVPEVTRYKAIYSVLRIRKIFLFLSFFCFFFFVARGFELRASCLLGSRPTP
jgi:hypothetical protein